MVTDVNTTHISPPGFASDTTDPVRNQIGSSRAPVSASVIVEAVLALWSGLESTTRQDLVREASSIGRRVPGEILFDLLQALYLKELLFALVSSHLGEMPPFLGETLARLFGEIPLLSSIENETNGELVGFNAAMKHFVTDHLRVFRPEEYPWTWNEVWSLREQLLAYEASLDSASTALVITEKTRASKRKRTGTYYTPRPLVHTIVGEAFTDLNINDGVIPTVFDPSCGTGGFLVEALYSLDKYFENRDQPRTRPVDSSLKAIAEQGLYGMDIDPVAVALTRARIWLCATNFDIDENLLCSHILVGNPLLLSLPDISSNSELESWGNLYPSVSIERPGEGFDYVIGNPPFVNQLRGGGVMVEEIRQVIGSATNIEIRPYTDISALFLALSIEITKDRGTVALIQPLSVLSSRDAAPIRRSVAKTCDPIRLSFPESNFFDAAVGICVPLLKKKSSTTNQRSCTTSTLHGSDHDRRSWSTHLARELGIPGRALEGGDWTISDLAEATADFRDQFYWISSHCEEEDRLLSTQDSVKIISTRLVDPMYCQWGVTPAKIGGRRFYRPTFQLSRAALHPEIDRWSRARLVPKLILSTQTSILEVLPDPEGVLLPSVPLISVYGFSQIWQVCAALCSPTISAHAAHSHLGSGLSRRAIKLSSRDVLALPLPLNQSKWDKGAELMAEIWDTPLAKRGMLWSEFGLSMQLAYELVDHQVHNWWMTHIKKATDRALNT